MDERGVTHVDQQECIRGVAEKSEDYSKLLESIDAVSKIENGARFSDRVICISRNLWDGFIEEKAKHDKAMETAKYKILKLKAERDWYKQHYAELLVKCEPQPVPDTSPVPGKCPVCGGELTPIEICTLPPIHKLECGNCGWNKEIT